MPAVTREAGEWQRVRRDRETLSDEDNRRNHAVKVRGQDPDTAGNGGHRDQLWAGTLRSEDSRSLNLLRLATRRGCHSQSPLSRHVHRSFP
ncbi:hypothetical protein E2C01_006924 [Portunus trituberculatus]|uniref:Uncharacterized protein n=1 Tax=Portunus trituberculatus TaxID=210409 RepID=A0A5B7CWF5_PORTR|nr:hypothetical protein [Portunus trituberculatus]